MSPMQGRRDSTCQTRSCILQIQQVVRKIVELCYDSLIQASLFFVEWLEFVILASSSAVCRGRRRDWLRLAESQLVDNLSATSQIRRKDQPILAPSQRTIENAESLLINRLGSDHLITGLPSFLECRPHLRYLLTRTSDKHVIAMHRPRDGAQLIVEAATRHSANGETATDEPFLNSPHDAAAGRIPYNALRSFPTCVVPNSAGT